MDPCSPQSPRALAPAARPPRFHLGATATGILVGLWGVAAITGASWLTISSARPKSTEPASTDVATSLPTVSHTSPEAKPWTLVMGLHPKCPCSQASLAELERLISETAGQVQVKVLVTVPPDAGTDWTDTRNISRARSLPGAQIEIDPDGRHAAALGLHVSGEVALYDATGQLAIAGGITAARGHEGDSTGHDAIRTLLRENPAGLLNATPMRFQTFGCALVRPQTSPTANNSTPRMP